MDYINYWIPAFACLQQAGRNDDKGNKYIPTTSMIKVGAFEAKTHLSSLLDKVSRGEEVVITRRGKAIARLVPAARAERSRLGATINTLLSLRKEVRLQGVDWKALRDRGRQ